MKEKHDMAESEAQRSPCAQRFLRSATNSASETPTGYLSSSEKSDGDAKSAINDSLRSAVGSIRKSKVNGVRTNGAQTNEAQTNGVKTNGIKVNGIKTNGVKANGVQSNGVQSNGAQTKEAKTNGTQENGEKKETTEKKLTNGETDGPKKRVTILKNSITPPLSSSSTPQRVRRSQSLSSTRSTFSEFEKSCLKAHNDYRAKHAVPPLKLSKRLCRFSEEWAKVCSFKIFSKEILSIFSEFNLNSKIFCRFWLHVAPRCIETTVHMVKIYSVHGVRFQTW